MSHGKIDISEMEDLTDADAKAFERDLIGVVYGPHFKAATMHSLGGGEGWKISIYISKKPRAARIKELEAENEIQKAANEDLHNQLEQLLSVQGCACLQDDEGLVTDRCIYHAWINKKLGRAVAPQTDGDLWKFRRDELAEMILRSERAAGVQTDE